MDAKVAKALKIATPSDREIVLTRTFDAPRRLVFKAMTTPEHVRQWYGCDLMTLVACEIDLRVGGVYRFTMRGPDGVDHTLKGTYREISAPDRIVFTEGYVTEGFTSDEAMVMSTFVESGGKTTLTVTVLHKSRENRDMHLKSGMENGAGESYDRLAAVVAAMADAA
jgi:uncharacterized protein YndB with AHSA1/START domain